MSKLRQTMIEKFGSEEAWKQHMRENGRKGGAKSGLRLRENPELARQIGRKGGRPRKNKDA